jgi:hypothetical protein
LYVVKVAPEMPHRLASDAQPSPDTTEMVRQLAAVVRDVKHERNRVKTTAVALRVVTMVTVRLKDAQIPDEGCNCEARKPI